MGIITVSEHHGNMYANLYILKPIANLNYNITQNRNSDKGESGKFWASMKNL